MNLEISALIDLFAATRLTEGRSKKTVEWYRYLLGQFAEFTSSDRTARLSEISIDDARDFVASLQKRTTRFENHPFAPPREGGLSPHTIHAYVRALKAFSSWLGEEEFTHGDVFSRLKRPKLPSPMIEILSDEELKGLFSVINPNCGLGSRMYAIALVLLDTGIRASELCTLTLDNTHIDEDYLKVQGKGNKERIVPFGTTTKKALLRYVSVWRSEPFDQNNDELFRSVEGTLLSYDALRQAIKRTGVLNHTSGINTVGYLSVQREGKYEYLGGRLIIESGLDLDGDLEFGSQEVRLRGDGLLNFSRGRILNAERARVYTGRDSLTIFAENFDPQAQLKKFKSKGLVHFAGNDLVLDRGQGFTGWGSIDDHVETSGRIRAANDGRIDLRNGLFVHQGQVDLGQGKLTVLKDRSGMNGGRLTAGSMSVGTALAGGILPDGTHVIYPRALFQQTGGSTTIGGLSISRGSYELRSGVLVTDSISIGGPYGPVGDSTFIQTGGFCRVDHFLHLGSFVPPVTAGFFNEVDTSTAVSLGISTSSSQISLWRSNEIAEIELQPITYELNDGRLLAREIVVDGQFGRTQFVQTGGIVNVSGEVRINGRESLYSISGGQLTTANLSVGQRHGASEKLER